MNRRRSDRRRWGACASCGITARSRGSASRWPTPWSTPIVAASCIATSSRRTCSSTRWATSGSPTSAWPSSRRATTRPSRGELVGTLRYMAPERFRGTSDRRGDIYSLGATLYELLALRPPFEETDQIRLIERIRNDAPPPPRQLDRNIPRDLETIVLKALAKEPGGPVRLGGGDGRRAAAVRRGRPIRSRPVSVVEQFWRWCKRDPWLAAASIAAAALDDRAGRRVDRQPRSTSATSGRAADRAPRSDAARAKPVGVRSTPTPRKPEPADSAAGPASDSIASRRCARPRTSSTACRWGRNRPRGARRSATRRSPAWPSPT